MSIKRSVWLVCLALDNAAWPFFPGNFASGDSLYNVPIQMNPFSFVLVKVYLLQP